MALRPTFWYVTTKGKGSKDKHQRQDVFSIESKEKMWVVAPAELGGRKANLVTDIQSQE